MNTLNILGFLLIVTLGYFIVNLIDFSFSKIEKLFISFPLGLGIFTLTVFVMGNFEIRFSSINLIIALVIPCIFLAFLIKRKTPKTKLINISRPTYKKIFAGFKKIKFGYIDFMLIVVLFGLFIRSLIINFVWPPETWDTISLYDFRAKRIAETQSLGKEVFTNYSREETSYNYSYPFMTSISHALVYIWGGNNPRFIYSLFYVTLLGMFFSIVRRKRSLRVSLIFTILLGLVPEYMYHSIIQYTNLPYTLYFGLGSLYLLEWFFDKQNRYLVLSAMMIGLSTWVRSQEPFWMVPIILLLVYKIISKNVSIKSISLYTVAILIVRFLWSSYVKRTFVEIGWPEIKLVETSLSLDFSKIIPSVKYAVENVFLSRKSVSILFFAIFLKNIFDKQIKYMFYTILFIILCLLMIFFGTYFYSINFTWWNEIGGSMARMTLYLPLVFYYFVFRGTTYLDNKKVKNE